MSYEETFTFIDCAIGCFFTSLFWRRKPYHTRMALKTTTWQLTAGRLLTVMQTLVSPTPPMRVTTDSDSVTLRLHRSISSRPNSQVRTEVWKWSSTTSNKVQIFPKLSKWAIPLPQPMLQHLRGTTRLLPPLRGSSIVPPILLELNTLQWNIRRMTNTTSTLMTLALPCLLHVRNLEIWM